MLMLPAPPKLLCLVALLLGPLLIASPLSAEAQQPRNSSGGGQQLNLQVPRNYGVGGTSLTLRDVWGPAKMPPAPTDFGPHFDYPPESLNNAPTHSPYPN